MAESKDVDQQKSASIQEWGYQRYSNLVDNWVRLKRLGWGLFSSAFVLFVAGVGLTSLPKLIKLSDASPVTGILVNIGTGFIAASVLTVTLEYQSQKQRLEDLNATVETIRSSTVDSLLIELAGDKRIFEEVKNSIFKQNCIRDKFLVRFRLDWQKDSQKKYLLKEMTLQYAVKNISSHEIDYQFCLFEEKECEDIYPGNAKVTKAVFALCDDPDDLDSIKCEDIVDNDDNPIHIEEKSDFVKFLHLRKSIKLPPGKTVSFRVSLEGIVEASNSYPFVSLVSSTGLDFYITYYPEDLQVEAFALHPNSRKLKELVNDRCTRMWSLTTGLLPGQGVLLRWKSKVDQIDQRVQQQVEKLPLTPLLPEMEKRLTQTMLSENSKNS